MASGRDEQIIRGTRVALFAAFAIAMLVAVVFGLTTGVLPVAKARSVRLESEPAFFALAILIEAILGLGAATLAWRGYREMRR